MAKDYLKIGDGVYEEIPREVNAASIIISDMQKKLGYPQDPYSDSGKKMMKILIAIWEDLYPHDAREWYATRKEYQSNELSITQQLAGHTGRSLASVPSQIYEMMKVVFPKYKCRKREDWMKLVKYYPMFQMANKV